MLLRLNISVYVLDVALEVNLIMGVFSLVRNLWAWLYVPRLVFLEDVLGKKSVTNTFVMI